MTAIKPSHTIYNSEKCLKLFIILSFLISHREATDIEFCDAVKIIVILGISCFVYGKNNHLVGIVSYDEPIYIEEEDWKGNKKGREGETVSLQVLMYTAAFSISWSETYFEVIAIYNDLFKILLLIQSKLYEQVSTAVKMWSFVFWVMTLCRLTRGYSNTEQYGAPVFTPLYCPFVPWLRRVYGCPKLWWSLQYYTASRAHSIR